MSFIYNTITNLFTDKDTTVTNNTNTENNETTEKKEVTKVTLVTVSFTQGVEECLIFLYPSELIPDDYKLLDCDFVFSDRLEDLFNDYKRITEEQQAIYRQHNIFNESLTLPIEDLITRDDLKVTRYISMSSM